MGTKSLVSVCGVALALGCGGSLDAVSEPAPERPKPDSAPSLTDSEPSVANGDVRVERRQSSAWQFLVADPGQPYGRGRLTLSGYDLSLLLDAAGTPHIAYTAGLSQLGDQLRHAWLEGGVFQSDVVDEYSRAHKSWLRGAPELRLVYNNYSYASIGFQARRDEGGSWSRETFEVSGDAAAISGTWRDGRAQIAYVSALSSASNETKQGVTFADSDLPDAFVEYAYERVDAFSSLAIDASGTAHLLYTAPAREIPKLSEKLPAAVRYVTVRDGVWSEPETLTEPGHYAGLSLVIDGEGLSHVSFTRSRPLDSELLTQASEVIYLTRAAGNADWQRVLLPAGSGAVASRESLAVTADGTVLLAYCALDAEGGRCGGLRLATLRDGAWSSESIDDGCVDLGALATVQLAADGSVHVAYQGCERELMYAVRSGG
ncbi:MAG: hypothetical protein ABW217_09715 [Polyangiaceae bacterium]